MQINGFPVERKKLEELTKAPYNPRKISPEMASALKRSLQEFGNVEPIIWNKQTGHIVGGHQRFDALLSIGETETDVVIVDMPEEREQALNIALNKISGDWNFGTLSDVLLSLHDDMRELTGFTEDEIAALLPKQEGLTDPDAIPEVVEPVARLGDIWQLGEHRLMCGDSTDAGSVALLMDGGDIELLLTDPPYGIDIVKGARIGISQPQPVGFGKICGSKPFGKGRVGGKGLVEARDYKPIAGDNKPFDPTFLLQYCKTQIIFGANYFSDKLPSSSCWIVWDKGVAEGSTFSKAELAFVSSGGHVLMYKHSWSGLIREGSRKVELSDRVHPTQKPVGLFVQILEDFKCKSILDLFLGSGSTLIACEQLNRKCYGMELDPHYCDVIIKRWEDFTGKKAVKIA